MNRLLTASRLLADLPLTKVDGQIEFTVRATSCAGDQVVELIAPQRPGKSEYDECRQTGGRLNGIRAVISRPRFSDAAFAVGPTKTPT
jgi:hypothetical protein